MLIAAVRAIALGAVLVVRAPPSWRSDSRVFGWDTLVSLLVGLVLAFVFAGYAAIRS